MLLLAAESFEGTAMQRFIFYAAPLACLLTIGSSATADQLYWNSGSAIHRAALNGSGVQDLTPTILNEGIALDASGNQMFWTGELPTVPAGPTGVIRRSTLDGSGAIPVLANIQTPLGIALDVAGGKMYWTAADNAVRRANLDGTNVEQLIKQDSIAELSGIALDLIHKRLYFSYVNPLIDNLRPGAIGVMNFDGSEFQAVVGSLVNPQGVALDVAQNQLYWADADRLQRADFSGQNQQDLVAGLTSPFGVALDLTDKNLFWTDRAAGKLQRAPLGGGEAIDVFTHLTDPTAIAILITVPEPGCLALAACGVFYVAGFLRYRRDTAD